MHTTQQGAPLVAVGTAGLERTAVTGGGVGTIALESFLVQGGLEVQERSVGAAIGILLGLILEGFFAKERRAL